MTSSIATQTRTITPRFILGTGLVTIVTTLVALAMAALLSGTATLSYPRESPPIALAIHVMTVIPSLLLGAYVMAGRKGTTLHKRLGRIWAVLMMVTAISSFWLQGLIGGIGPIHIFSVMTLISIPRAIFAIRRGDVKTHEQAMTGPFIGLLVAGLFSFVPGRLLGDIVLSLV